VVPGSDGGGGGGGCGCCVGGEREEVVDCVMLVGGARHAGDVRG